MNQLKTFLKQTLPAKSFIYYNNPKSIKIQIPTNFDQTLIQHLNSTSTPFTISYPEYIIKNLHFIKNMCEIRIKK